MDMDQSVENGQVYNEDGFPAPRFICTLIFILFFAYRKISTLARSEKPWVHIFLPLF
jgi:hypothetical protein